MTPPGARGAGAASRPAADRTTRCARPAVRPRPTTACGPGPSGIVSVARSTTVVTGVQPGCAQRAAGRRPRPSTRLEQFAGVAPQGVQGALHPAVALLGAVTEPQRPLLGVVAVVGDLLDRLGRERRELAVRPAASCRVQQLLVGGEVQLPGDRVGRSRRWAAPPTARCGRRVPRAGRPTRPRRRPVSSRKRAWPSRSSAMLASATSSSSTGAWPAHSAQPVGEHQRVVAERAQRRRWSRRVTGASPLPGSRRTSGGGRPCRRPARRTGPSRPGRRR